MIISDFFRQKITFFYLIVYHKYYLVYYMSIPVAKDYGPYNILELLATNIMWLLIIKKARENNLKGELQ